ncbi:MAG: hypothetical protein ABJM19_00685 [Marinobacter sp.]|uniref:hypothetical protein n=1 Tax=unclassified Marinobacter TaxID=83889 RepID=UPI00273CD640|nr:MULTISPECIES: hypothetical protein [unclassified Marinobacter]MDP4547683.1 hypothetical protein [Marinobacter sp. MDS2]
MTHMNDNLQWWRGLADVLGHGLQHGATKLRRVHLSVADETFRALDVIPVVRPVNRTVRACHHGISKLSYSSVSCAGRVVVELAGVSPNEGIAGSADEETMNKS